LQDWTMGTSQAPFHMMSSTLILSSGRSSAYLQGHSSLGYSMSIRSSTEL
jgi:hypothetical protein